MSGWELSGGKCPGRHFFGWEMSGGELSVGESCPGKTVRGRNCPGWNLPKTVSHCIIYDEFLLTYVVGYYCTIDPWCLVVPQRR